MKAGSGLIIAGVIILAIGLVWLFLGIGTPGTVPGPAGSFTGSILPTVTPTPVITEIPAAVTTTGTPVAVTTLPPSPDAVRLHFLDLAFGAGNTYLERWSPTEKNGRIVISMEGNRDSDAAAVQSAIQEFNSLSRTNQVSTQVKQGSATGDIVIKFVTESGMEAIPLNTSQRLTNREIVRDGTPLAKITLGTIYINNELKGDDRDHAILRSLFYELGAVGDSDVYPDSLFYSGLNANTALTTIDKEAIRLMYGGSYTPGMSANDVKGLLYVR